MSIYNYLPNDRYKPNIDKPELGQYDNYQIHDLYCNDTVYQDLTVSGVNITAPSPAKFRNWLAVERISIHGNIECNFEAIAIQYP